LKKEGPGLLPSAGAALDVIMEYPKEFLQGIIGVIQAPQIWEELKRVDEGKQQDTPILNKNNAQGRME
jgi:hypothetical protein